VVRIFAYPTLDQAKHYLCNSIPKRLVLTSALTDMLASWRDDFPSYPQPRLFYLVFILFVEANSFFKTMV